MGNDGVPATAAEVVAVAAVELTDAVSWWHDVDDSPAWQDRLFYTLAVLYGIVATIALVQLARIQLRVPDYGWTTQKVFHFLNFLVNAVRCLVFIFFRGVQRLQPEILKHILLDVPSLAFFTTYALLVLFWAEIYYQARAVSTDGLKPSFYTINIVVYVVQNVESTPTKDIMKQREQRYAAVTKVTGDRSELKTAEIIGLQETVTGWLENAGLHWKYC